MGRRGKAAAMTGGMAIVEALIANGVDTVFGLPGAQLYPLFDALQQKSDAIRTIGARHEQACGYMAFGYARSTGRPAWGWQRAQAARRTRWPPSCPTPSRWQPAPADPTASAETPR